MNPTDLQRLRDCLGYLDMVRNNLFEIDYSKFAEDIMELDKARANIQAEAQYLIAMGED